MSEILKRIADHTHGRSFGTRKFCHDDKRSVPIAYDDHQVFVWKRRGESVDHKKPVDLSLLSKDLIVDGYEPIFRYFLDGTRRTYKVDDIDYSGQIYPVIAGQIAVGSCERFQARMSVKQEQVFRDFVLVLPDVADPNGHHSEQFFNRLVREINGIPSLKRHRIEFTKILRYHSLKNDTEKMEDKGIAKIQEFMIELEKDAVGELVKANKLSSGSYLVKDGSLEYQRMNTDDPRRWAAIRSNYQYVVGVSKSFNPLNCKDRKGKVVSGDIATLPPFHRTPVQMYETDRVSDPNDPVFFAIWYLRIRESKFTQSPFDGVLKIEKVLVTEKEMAEGIDTETADMISANLINERNPVCWGSDTRWANHLYPVYLTEKYLKSRFISSYHFLSIF